MRYFKHLIAAATLMSLSCMVYAEVQLTNEPAAPSGNVKAISGNPAENDFYIVSTDAATNGPKVQEALETLSDADEIDEHVAAAKLAAAVKKEALFAKPKPKATAVKSAPTPVSAPATSKIAAVQHKAPHAVQLAAKSPAKNKPIQIEHKKLQEQISEKDLNQLKLALTTSTPDAGMTPKDERISTQDITKLKVALDKAIKASDVETVAKPESKVVAQKEVNVMSESVARIAEGQSKSADVSKSPAEAVAANTKKPLGMVDVAQLQAALKDAEEHVDTRPIMPHIIEAFKAPLPAPVVHKSAMKKVVAHVKQRSVKVHHVLAKQSKKAALVASKAKHVKTNKVAANKMHKHVKKAEKILTFRVHVYQPDKKPVHLAVRSKKIVTGLSLNHQAKLKQAVIV